MSNKTKKIAQNVTNLDKKIMRDIKLYINGCPLHKRIKYAIRIIFKQF